MLTNQFNLLITSIMFFSFLNFSEGTVDPADIEDLFNQLEDYSDSQPDDNDDTISIGSTPKPSLKPFFCSSRYEKKNLSKYEIQIFLFIRIFLTFEPITGFCRKVDFSVRSFLDFLFELCFITNCFIIRLKA